VSASISEDIGASGIVTKDKGKGRGKDTNREVSSINIQSEKEIGNDKKKTLAKGGVKEDVTSEVRGEIKNKNSVIERQEESEGKKVKPSKLKKVAASKTDNVNQIDTISSSTCSSTTTSSSTSSSSSSSSSSSVKAIAVDRSTEIEHADNVIAISGFDKR
jgi:hypothetical protein